VKVIVAERFLTYNTEDQAAGRLNVDEHGVLQPVDTSDLEQEISRLSVETELETVLHGHYESTASGIVVEYKDVVAGMPYKIVLYNPVNGDKNFEKYFVYLIHSDGTNTRPTFETYSYGCVYRVVPAEGDYIRLYMNKLAAASSCSCNYAIYKDDDVRLDTLDERATNLENQNHTTCKIFRKVVCCGDSYTAGYIVDSSGVAHETNEEYAWPHYMSTATGNTWVNCGKSGANVLTWQTNERGLPKAQSAGKAQAYVVGLMLNDVAVDTTRYVELGTSADIGTTAQTYYGGLSQIVEALATISPKAKIFICTCPRTNNLYPSYNQAVYDVVDYYKDTYAVHCLDLLANADLYDIASLTGDLKSGHYTAIGYEQFAEIMCKIMSDYINEHITEFQDVPFIEYDAD